MEEKNLKGIGLFAMCVTHLISVGNYETFTEIEKHFDNSDLVEYISTKYKKDMIINFDNSIYDNQAINAYFHNYSGYIEGNEARKYGIVDENHGLLLILVLLLDKVEEASINWTIKE